MSDLFVKATKKKIRFTTSKGELSTEDLWDLSLEDLDRIAVAASKKSEGTEKSFIRKTSQAETLDKLRFDVVKYVIDYKLKAKDAAAKRAETLAEKEFLEGILAEKKISALKDLSEDEIKAKLATLGS